MSSIGQSLEYFEETKKHAGQLIEVLQNPKFQENYTRTLDGVSRLKDGSSKNTKRQQETLSKMRAEKMIVAKGITETCSSITGTDRSALEDVSEVVASENNRLMELEGLVTARSKQNRAIAKAQVQVKLLQSVLPVQFDLNSTHSNIKGFIRKPNSKIEPFSFSSPDHTVANALWTAASYHS